MFKFGRKTADKYVVNRVAQASVGTMCLDIPEWFAQCPQKGWRWVRNRDKATVFESKERAESLVQWTSMPDHHNYSIKSI